jgi:general secretion pathway protein G
MTRLAPVWCGPCRGARRGFTLIELLVVMAVLGVLSMLLWPMAELTVQRDRERELKAALWQIREAIDEYHRVAKAGGVAAAPGESSYPPNLVALTQGVPDARASGRTIFFLRRIPRDPFADPALPAEATWALRSYASPPDRPEPGRDVYDVASRSTKIGLNGVPLKDW